MKRVAKIILGLSLTVISMVTLIGSAIASGFYQQIIATGFVPDALIAITMLLSIVGLGGGIAILVVEGFDE